jgi:hypothetical protein
MCAERRLIAVLLLLLSAAPAEAAVLEGSITTLLQGRADPRDGNVYSVVPLYQALRLSLRGVRARGMDELRLELSVWGGALLGEPLGGQRAFGDIDLGYLEASFLRHRLEVRLGRQVVTGGAFRFSHIDGGSATVRLFRGLHLMVMGGIPVLPRFSARVGEAAAGGRLFYRFGWSGELGLSFLHLHDQGRTARQDLGLDLRVQVGPKLALTGLGVLSLIELRLAELAVGATWQPLPQLDVRGEYRRQSPDLFIPRSSIFSVFSMETRDEVGLMLDARPRRRVVVTGDYYAIFDATGTGHRAGVKGEVALGALHEFVVGTQLRLLLLPTKGYYQARLFCRWRLLPTLDVTFDADAYLFDRPVNGRSYSFVGAGALAWRFARAWQVVASAAGSTTPFVEAGFDVMAKLAYNPIFRFREVAP